jgi:hypothetical protein
MDHQKVGWGHMDWIDLAQDDVRRGLVNAVMKFRVRELRSSGLLRDE